MNKPLALDVLMRLWMGLVIATSTLLANSAFAQRDGDNKRYSDYGSKEIKIADPAEWSKDLEKPIFSGPQPGEKVPSLTVIQLRGDKAGQEFDPVALAGDKLHLMFFVGKARTFGRFLGQQKQQLQAIEKNSKRPWAMSVIVCSDDANEVEKNFAWADKAYPKDLVAGLSKDGSAGPPSYGLDKNITATVIVVKDGKVTHNLPYVTNAFYTQPHILGAIASAMDVDHDTLRKYIGGTAGDMAAAYGGRRKAGSGQAGEQPNAANNGLREGLAKLVQSGKITRDEAGELFKVSGDANALRTKLTELLKAEKITRKDIGTLLAPSQSKSEQRGQKR